MIRWKWLMVVWVGFVMALSAEADNGVQTTCTQTVLTDAPPQIRAGISIALDPAEPVSPTFSNTLKYPARTEDRAIAFAQVQGEATLSFQGKGDTWVKYSPHTHELVIVVRGHILFYEDLSQRRFEFERPQDVFDSLYRAQVRGQKGIAHAEPFEHFSRDRHFREHGHEFGAHDETSYEAEALEFAERDCRDCLAIDFTEHGQPRTFKADFSTREVVITGRGQRIVTYYKNEGALNPYRKFFSNLLKLAAN